MSAGVFGNSRNMSLEISELDPASFLTAPVLAWQAASKKTKKKTKVKLDLLTNFDMLLMVEKGITEKNQVSNYVSFISPSN